MSDDEKDIQDLIRKFKMQHEQNINNLHVQQPEANLSYINNSQLSISDNNQVINIPPSNPPPASVPTGNVCQQCKTIHPALRMGEKCPMAPDEVSDYGLDSVSVSKFVVNIKNMIISQMDKKEIKDGNKFFQFTIIELMKILESYNE
jgi:hypothetical protein